MKILILGAGAVSSILSKMLARERNVSRIVCGSPDLNAARKFIKNSHKKTSLIRLDAGSIIQIRKAAKGMNLIINASLPDFNEKAMSAALQSRCHYQDLCSHLKDLVTPEQLKFHEQFKKAGLKAIINTGIAPGITNLLARDIADSMTGLEELKFRLLEDQESTKFIPTWSIAVTMDELKSNPLFYLNGRNKLVGAFDGEETYEFPAPVGPKMVCNIYGDEVSTLPKYLKVRNITYKAGGSDMDYARLLKKKGLPGNKSIRATPPPEVPSPATMKKYLAQGTIKNARFVSVVEGIGLKSGKQVSIKKMAIYPDLKNITKKCPGATYISYPTALAAYLFTKTIPRITQTGVFPPEALDKEIRDDILKNLKKEIPDMRTITTRLNS